MKHPWLVLLVVLAALLATLPLMLAGCSCGHDFGFHLQSWLDGAEQLRHGTLYPSWAYSPAYNAGEPRFIFYPPLSWMLGAALASVFPFAAVPALYTWCVLAAAGLSMFAVARRFVSPHAAFVAAVLYLGSPYMLFTAFERTAFAELLAAVWLPWLFLAVWRERPTVHAVALPLALVWLTNAPAAVMGSYTLALLGLNRVVRAARSMPEDSSLHAWPLARTLIAGTALGLAMPAFYLLPAAYERRFVQISMALVPGLSYPNNFLFHHTADKAHDAVLHQASMLAVSLLTLTAILLALLYWLRRKRTDEEVSEESTTRPLPSFAMIAVIIAFLLEPLSAPVWKHLPELAFLQFPWRFLAVLGVVLALTTGFLANRFRSRGTVYAVTALALVAVSTFSVSRNYLYPCDAQEKPAEVARLFRSSHGVSPTDEYTPNGGDNDVLRSNNPAYWLADTADAFAAGTTPNPNATQPDVDFGEPPPELTLSGQVPHHFTVQLTKQQVLVLNLRDYPNWRVTNTNSSAESLEEPQHLKRDDGLIAIPLPPGQSVIDITWVRGWDRDLGLAISGCALALFLLALRRSRRIGF